MVDVSYPRETQPINNTLETEINVTNRNVLESRLKKQISLIPGTTNASWPREGVGIALWAMQDNKQLYNRKFIDIIGDEAQLVYKNWTERQKKKRNNNLFFSASSMFFLYLEKNNE